MAHYTVKQLARLSGVSVRTLHHYDEIGLLVPSFLGENRYRYYGREELERLQQILVYRELGVPLAQIGQLLAVKDRNRLALLTEHRALLAERVRRSRQLLRTIDATIAQLQGEGQVDDKDLYRGFGPEKQAEYEEWLFNRYGDDMRQRIEQGKARVAQLGKDGMALMKAQAEGVFADLAAAFQAGTEGDDPAMVPLLDRHRDCIAAMWDRPCPARAYAGVARLYLEHPDFKLRMDVRGEGFTEWLSAAMQDHAAQLEGTEA